MTGSLKQFKTRALARPEVKKAYDELSEEFSFMDEVLKARTASGLAQAGLAARVGVLAHCHDPDHGAATSTRISFRRRKGRVQGGS